MPRRARAIEMLNLKTTPFSECLSAQFCARHLRKRGVKSLILKAFVAFMIAAMARAYAIFNRHKKL